MVSSDTEPHESKPTNAQPETAIAAMNPAKYVPLLKLAPAPSPSHRYEIGWLRKNSSNSTPISTLAMHSATIPTLTTYFKGLRPTALTKVVTTSSPSAHSTCWLGEGVASNTAASQTEPK